MRSLSSPGRVPQKWQYAANLSSSRFPDFFIFFSRFNTVVTQTLINPLTSPRSPCNLLFSQKLTNGFSESIRYYLTYSSAVRYDSLFGSLIGSVFVPGSSVLHVLNPGVVVSLEHSVKLLLGFQTFEVKKGFPSFPRRACVTAPS